ncbi:tail fiber protein [Pseudomonas phage PPpW-4]|uniref:Probable tail spike protein n=1 Tax=Pseudomonas phage PPpW-4 TaxID=1279083 RepID=V5YUX4_9CAUD|nr:tail fiber protein [Pseudomonas phage PPpW-4]BAO20711.1 putative tail fiber protein [Pseudomonas phage PPpW-4]
MATPKTVKTYPLDGVQKDFEIPFEYLARKFVVVTLIGPDRLPLVLNVDYRFTSRTVITVSRAWVPSEGYTLLEIRRMTSATERLVDFSDGSVLRASDLNTSSVQALHISEEGRDIATDTIGVDNDGNLDARGRQIKNLADGVAPGDAVNVRQVSEILANVAIQKRFLMPRMTHPFTRDDGSPLQLGDRYLNQSGGIEFIYVNGMWQANNLDGQIVSSSAGASNIGTLSGTLQDQLDDMAVYPDRFGPIGNGFTSDTAAVQAAIDYCATTGRPLLGRPGVRYKIDRVVVKPGLRHFDFSRSVIEANAPTSQNAKYGCVHFAGPVGGQQVSVEGCMFSAKIDMKNGSRIAMYLDAALNNDFINVEISGFVDHPTLNHYGIIAAEGTSYNRFTMCRITGVDGPAARGLLLDFLGKGVPFGGYFSHNGVAQPNINPCVGNLVSGCVFINGSYAINLLGSENCVISGCILRGQNHRGIYIAEGSCRNLVSGCQILDFSSTAVLIGYCGYSNHLIGNVFRRDALILRGEAVVNITTGARDNTVSDNEIHANTNYGVYLACGTPGCIVRGNRISGYYMAGVAVETDWLPIASRPAGAIYSRPNYAPPGEASPGAVRWAFISQTGITIQANRIGAGYPGRNVAAIYLANVNSNSNLQVANVALKDNVVEATSNVVHYLYVFEETVGRVVSNKLVGTSVINETPAPSKYVIPRGRLNFSQLLDNDGVTGLTVTVPNGLTTPTASWGDRLEFGNSGSMVLVTNFTDGADNQEILVRLTGSTTLVHSSGFLRLRGGANAVGLGTNSFVKLFRASGVWWEAWRVGL